MTEVNSLTLLGCGKMGSALLAGWLQGGLKPGAIYVIEPNPTEWLKSLGTWLNEEPADWQPEFCVVAVKPQLIEQALVQITHYGDGPTVILSIVAGIRCKQFERILGSQTPVVRAMPNTPAAVSKGISALVGNENARPGHLSGAGKLLGAVGETVQVDSESLLDVVTGVSGSGPAYVFNLIEAMIKAGINEGLLPEVSKKLVISTVIGAGELARQAKETPEQLRINVTSPNGTTEAGLRYLMNEENGLEQLIGKTVRAAVARSRELGKKNEPNKV